MDREGDTFRQLPGLLDGNFSVLERHNAELPASKNRDSFARKSRRLERGVRRGVGVVFMEKGKCVWGSAATSRPAIATEDRLSVVHRVCLGLFLWFERYRRVVVVGE